MNKNLKLIEIIAFFIGLLYSIFLWLGNINLSPDSTNYIVSGQNFIKYGTFFYWANWPSLDILSRGEIFTDYPPGFSFLYSIFYLLFKTEFLAISISQAVYIVLFYLSFYLILNKLFINIFIKITLYLLIPFFSFYIPIITTYLTEILFIAITLFIAVCSINIIHSKNKTYWYLSLLLICFSTTIKYVGVINIIWLLIPIIQIKKLSTKLAAFIFLPILVLLPTLLWFWRNWGYLNGITKSHGIGNIFIVQNLYTPFNFLTASSIGIFGVYLLSIILFLIILFIIPNFLLKLYKTKDDLLISWSFLIFFVCDFVGVYLLSLITQINPLEYRLLATPVTILIIALLYAFNSSMQNSKVQCLIFIVPVIILLTISDTFKFQFKPIDHLLPHPREEALWEQLYRHKYFRDSELFYTEQNFLHQIYSRRPQQIIWVPKMISSKSGINDLFNSGSNTFFIFNLNSDYLIIFKNNYHDINDLCFINYSNFVVIFKSTNDMKCLNGDSNF